MKKPILCLDFDGVLHHYRSGWEGVDVVGDGPTPGAMRFIYRAVDVFDVHVYSTRSNDDLGRDAMIAAIREWVYDEFSVPVAERVFSSLSFPTAKPPAMVTLDDRAVTFTGSFPDPAALLAFKTWQGK
jgi:hypothetical protein